MTAPQKRQSQVIWYDRARGFGYLKVDGYPHDLFVHCASVREAEIPPDALLPGAKLLCNVGSRSGRPVAVALELLPV